jgi:hypothetical protein
MKKNPVKHKLDDLNDNAERLTYYGFSRRENVANNDEYLSSLGLTNMQVVNPLK